MPPAACENYVKIISMAEDYCRNLSYVCYAFKQDYFIPLFEEYVESQSALLTLNFAEEYFCANFINMS